MAFFLPFSVTWSFISRKDNLVGNIHLLSEQTIDQIAAGEVIENPASVVKELFENAIDAGASHIVIEIMGGGFQSIRISDDGSGMSEEDALLCLKRHATSKIRSADDLIQLQTMGFRGEALASIAAISSLTLTTALPERIGVEVQVKGGNVLSVHPSARPQGTSIEVRSLFYNVPARKKFQKSAAASSAEITRVATILALAHPHVGIELIQQKKTVFSAPLGKTEHAKIPLLERRSADLLGSHFQAHMHTVFFQEKGCEVHGLIGDPRITRYNRSGQYLFVNARPVHCPLLSFAIRDGYGTRIDAARHPIYVIHATIDPSLIDVNVHPQKKDIRLREEDGIKQAMRTAVAQALQRPEAALALSMNIPSFHLSEIPDEPLQFFSECTGSFSPPLEKQISFSLEEEIQSVGLFEHYLLLEARKCPPSLLGQENTTGVIWVDLMAAEARILFERLMSTRSQYPRQGLLLPVTFSCSKAEAEKLQSSTDELDQLGIELRCIGPTVFLVEVIPSCLEEKEIYPILHALASALTEEGNIASEKRMKHLAQTICRLSRSRAKAFSLDEAMSVFKELSKTADPLHCPQGKPTFYHMRKNEIENHFQ